MKLLNQSGMSLIEVMVSAGLLGGLALAFTQYQKNSLKSEFDSQNRHAITQLEYQVDEHFSNRKTCSDSMLGAFKGVPIEIGEGTVTGGLPTYQRVIKKVRLPDGTIIDKPLFEKEMVYENGRISIEGVNYAIKDTLLSADGITHTGTLEVSVDFVRCSGLSTVKRKTASETQTLCPPTQQVKKSKIFTRNLAFSLDAGAITVLNPGLPEEKLDVSCSSGDAGLSEADEKACLLEAKLLATTGFQGETDCGWKVELKEKSQRFSNPSSSSWKTLPKNFAPGSLKITLVGGGGGGGGGDNDQPATGGTAGTAREYIPIPDSLAGANCYFGIGQPGGEGDNGGGTGKSGGTTSFKCPGSVAMYAYGGIGGVGKFLKDSDGIRGGASIYAPGGEPNGNEEGRPGVLGSGGAGGGDSGLKGRHGGAGGAGVIDLFWTELKITDKAGTIKTEDFIPIGPGTAPSGGGGGGGGCFVAGTQIELFGGGFKNIEDVQEGDELVDGAQNKIKVKTLVRYKHNGTVFGINGGRYFFTPNHPFKSVTGWKSLDPEKSMIESRIDQVTMMRVGDMLITNSGIEVIYTLDGIQSEVPVYNFEVTGSHEYIADGFVVHNLRVEDKME